MPVTDCLVPASADVTSVVSDADRRFLAAFEGCELPEGEWTHVAHVRVAWICLNLDDPQAALERIRRGILRYNTNVLQRRDKYHETVTVAFTRIVADRMRAGDVWSNFAQRIDDLLDPDDPLLLRYYSTQRLFSDDARLAFVEPDLKALPPLVGFSEVS